MSFIAFLLCTINIVVYIVFFLYGKKPSVPEPGHFGNDRAFLKMIQ